jgi:hypothetical protein
VTDTARPWTHAALFGAVWGAAEATLGSLLKATRLPLTGLVMAAVALVCLLTLRRLIPRTGVILTAAAVAATLKIFTLGGLFLGPILAILLEGAVLELAFLAGRGRTAAVAGGAVIFALAPLQLTLMVRVVAGRQALGAFEAAARATLAAAGLGDLAPWHLLAAVAGIAGLAGGWTAATAWRIAGRVEARVRGSTT